MSLHLLSGRGDWRLAYWAFFEILFLHNIMKKVDPPPRKNRSTPYNFHARSLVISRI